MQLASVPRKPCSHHEKFVMAAQAAPLSRGLAHGVTVFAYPEKFVTKSKIQHATTMAKTRATAMLRQQHLPPNVRRNTLHMRYSLLQLTCIIFLVSCNRTDKTKIIQDTEAYSIINDFILDSLNTVDLFAVETIDFWNLTLYPKGPPKEVPYFISFDDKLLDDLIKNNIIDSCKRELILEQMSQNSNFHWDSSKIELRCFSLKTIDQPQEGSPNEGPWDKIGKMYNARQFLILSKPIFIDNNTVLVSVNRMCNGLCGNGIILVISKINDKWTPLYETITWIS